MFKVDYDIVNVSTLKGFDAGSVVDLDSLKAKGLLPRKSQRWKVLGKGDIDRALTVRAHACSAKAKDAIAAAGGTVEEVS